MNLKSFLFLICFIFSTTISLANSVPNCDRALQIENLAVYMSKAQKEVEEQLRLAPHPGHVDLKEDGSILRKGVELPKTLKQFLRTQPGLKIEALATPSANAEHPSVATRFIPGTGFSAHLEVTQDSGKVLTTQAYINMPILFSINQLEDAYLFSPSKGHKLMFYHGHGGGTPMAESMNASSVAAFLVKYGIPLFAVDQHGHGKGPGVPLLSYDEKIEYNLSILEKTVHPEVKIILSGHSWGGEDLMYFYTQYLPKHRNGRFKSVLGQIVGLMPLSPPVDVTSGNGGARERVQIEEELFRTLADRPVGVNPVAEKDLEFMKNILRYGKSSLTATWRTLVTQIYLSLPIPDEELRKQLPQIKIYQGKYDGLVYVGREFAFEPWQKFLGENFVLMDTYPTIKKEEGPQKVGHQTFDSLDSEGNPIVYSGMLEMAEQQIGESIQEIQPDPRSRTDLVASLNRILVYYMSFFPAREFFNNRKVSVTQRLEKGAELSQRNAELRHYLDGIDRLKEENKKLYNQALEREIIDLSREYNIRGRVDGAYRELQMVPPSLERRSRLQSFVERAKKIDSDYYKSRVFEEDPSTRAKIQKALERENADYIKLYKHTEANLKAGEVLQGPTHIEDIGFRVFELDEAKIAFKGLIGAVEKIQDPSNAYSEVIIRYNLGLMLSGSHALSGFDPNSVNDLSPGQIKSLAESALGLVEAEIQNLRSFFKSPKAFVRESNKILDRVLQTLKGLKKEFNRETQEVTLRLISEIDPELGVKTIKDAEWELNTDYSDQGKQRIHNFLGRVEEVKSDLGRVYQMELERELLKYSQNNLPHGFSSLEEVETEISKIAAMTNSYYIPQGEGSEFSQIKILVERALDIEAQLASLREKRERTLSENDIKDLHKYKNKLLRKLDDLYKKSLVSVGPEDWPNGVMPFWWPNDLKEAVAKRENSLAQWKHLEAELSQEIYNYLLDKFEQQGQFYSEDFFEIPSSIAKKIQQFQVLRDHYFSDKNDVLKVFFNLMREGAFQVAPNANSGVPDFSKAKDHLYALLGDANWESADILDSQSIEGQSIEGKLRVVERQLFDLSQEESALEAELKQVHHDYSLLISKIEPQSLVKKENLVDVSHYLHIGLEKLSELLNEMTDDEVSTLSQALANAIKDWEEVWKPVVIETQMARPEWYPFYPEYYRAASGMSDY